MNNIDMSIIVFVTLFYVATIFIPRDYYSNLAEKLNRNQQGGDCNNEPDKIARQSSNETLFLRNYLRRVSQGANDREVKKILDNIIPNVIPNKKRKNSKQN